MVVPLNIEAPTDNAFEQLFTEFHGRLVGYARTVDPRGAEDAAQDAFEALRKRQMRPPPIESGLRTKLGEDS